MRKKKLLESSVAPVDVGVPLSKYQAFAVQRIRRADIKQAPINPRVIDPNARRKLQESLRRDGLVETLVVNKRTGHLVSGHQRLARLDALEETENYALDVAVIDVDTATEGRLVISMNNQGIQGNYDADLLKSLLDNLVAEDKNAATKAGFDLPDLQMLGMEDDALTRWFKAENQAPALAGAVGEIEAMNREAEEAKVKEREEKKIQALKDRKKEAKEVGTQSDAGNFYLTLIFPGAEERRAFLGKVGVTEDLLMIEGGLVERVLEDA